MLLFILLGDMYKIHIIILLTLSLNTKLHCHVASRLLEEELTSMSNEVPGCRSTLHSIEYTYIPAYRSHKT